MRFDEHLLTSALAVVRAGRGLASAIPVDTEQSACVKDLSYKLTAEQIRAMDETVDFRPRKAGV